MATILEHLFTFENSEPQICIWCKYCGAIITSGVWGYACIRSAEDMTKRHKGVIKPFPPNTEDSRTRVQCVNPDERHDCFVPTPATSKRMKLLDAMGLLEDI
jgi:hypothetical protein